MRCAVIADNPALNRVIVDSGCDTALEPSPMLLAVVEASAALPPDQLDQIGVLALARHCAISLQRELARPERRSDDWSIADFEPGDCCADCADLAAFLVDAARQQSVWPLAKPRRQHIHQRIDQAELPVTHETTRQGSPHKLVVTKSPDLVARDINRRARAQASLDSIQQLLGAISG